MGSALRFRLVLAMVAGFAVACHRIPQTVGPLTQDVYVWQRVWSAGAQTALEQAREPLHSCVVLAAEISVANPVPKITRPALDYGALRAAGKPIGLAIRIDP